MTDIDIDAYLAASRKRVRLATERAETALARLGGETRPRRSHRTLDDLTAEEIDRDTRTMKNVLRTWKRMRHHRCVGTSTIGLPSGRQIVYDWKKEEVVK
jgi:hypothetical protein